MAGDVIKFTGQNIFFTGHETLFCKNRQLLLLQWLNIFTMFLIFDATGVSIKCIFPQFYLLIIAIQHYSITESHYF